MPVHQCPKCPLRFLSRSEVQDHLATDHPERDLRLTTKQKSVPVPARPYGRPHA